jgi:hypothetical protein
MPTTDPFDTAAIRSAVLAAWAASPARFREDANAEEALALGGYADRVMVELLANAVDAARAVGEPARVRLRIVDGELRVANTGAALTAAGVQALSTLRASAKRDDDAAVGHFGVGFTAVVGVTDAPVVLSRSGGVRFDRAATAMAVRATAVAGLVDELDRRQGAAPARRMPWPADQGTDPIPDGYVTEVRLPLRSPDLAAPLAAELAGGVEQFFWALPGLTELDLPDRVIRRVDEPDGTVELRSGTDVERFRVVGRSGSVDPRDLAGRPVEERGRRGWSVTWALPLADAAPSAPDPLDPGGQVSSAIGAPTPTDDLLGLPARLVGTFPVDDTRRHIVDGPLTEHLLDEAVAAYLDLMWAVQPPDRLALVPPAGFPRGRPDAVLRDRITERMTVAPMLRSSAGDPIEPRLAVVLPGSGPLAALLADALPTLVPDPGTAAGLDALRRLGVRTLGLADAIAELSGIRRPAVFWAQVYAALDGSPTDALAGLPVPLVDGRQVIGPRGLLLAEPETPVDGLARHVPGLSVVDPAAAHPLLLRLGAIPADPSTLLAAPELAAQLAARLDGEDEQDLDPDDPDAFAFAVGDLVAAGGRVPDERLADLLLTDTDGEQCPAGELRLPDAALAPLVDPDAFGVVGSGWLQRWPREVLLAIGVRDGFRVVPVVGPDGEPADLADVDQWWAEVVGDRPPPDDATAVADLDLVQDAAWVPALQVLAADRDARAALHAADVSPTYSAWWLSRFAVLDGRALTDFRLAGADDLEGLYDPLPMDLAGDVAAALGVRTGLAQALDADPADVLSRFADPARTVAPYAVPALTGRLVNRLADVEDLPTAVRVLSGAVVGAAAVVVPDGPWWAQLIAPDQLVAPGSDPRATARTLDLDLASERYRVSLTQDERISTTEWSAAAERAAAALGVPAPELRAVTGLRAALDDDEPVPVRWWIDDDGRATVDGSAEGLGRAIAWLTGRWPARETAVAAARSDPVGLAEHAWD